MRAAAQAVLMVLSFGALACASTPLSRQGDQALAAGDCKSAVAAYERLLQEVKRVPDLDAVLFRLAACRSLTGSGIEDRAAARRYLERLLWGFPRSPYAVPARVLLEHETELTGLEAELESARGTAADRERALAELEQRIATAGEKAETADTNGEKLTLELASLRSRVATLSKDLAAKLAEIERLQRALQALKEIDLGSPP